MLKKDNSYSGTFELGKIPDSNDGLNLLRVYLHLTWIPENARRRGYWCLQAVPEIMDHARNAVLMIVPGVFDLIEQNGWRKYIKEKTVYDMLYGMRHWFNNYQYRGTPSQESAIKAATEAGIMVRGNEAEYLRSIHMDTVVYTGIGYTREYFNECYTYGSDILVKEIPVGVEYVLEELFSMPSVYRKLNNTKVLQDQITPRSWM